MGLVAVFLVGLGVIGATLIGQTWAGGSWKHRSDITSAHDAREHARDIAAWITGSVDASDEQGEKIDTILVDLADRLYPIAEHHREQHRDLLTAASRPDVDRKSLEQIRAQALTLADQATSAMVDAFVAIADVLEPEQRQTLIALATEFERHHH